MSIEISDANIEDISNIINENEDSNISYSELETFSRKKIVTRKYDVSEEGMLIVYEEIFSLAIF